MPPVRPAAEPICRHSNARSLKEFCGWGEVTFGGSATPNCGIAGIWICCGGGVGNDGALIPGRRGCGHACEPSTTANANRSKASNNLVRAIASTMNASITDLIGSRAAPHFIANKPDPKSMSGKCRPKPTCRDLIRIMGTPTQVWTLRSVAGADDAYDQTAATPTIDVRGAMHQVPVRGIGWTAGHFKGVNPTDRACRHERTATWTTCNNDAVHWASKISDALHLGKMRINRYSGRQRQ